MTFVGKSFTYRPRKFEKAITSVKIFPEENIIQLIRTIKGFRRFSIWKVQLGDRLCYSSVRAAGPFVRSIPQSPLYGDLVFRLAFLRVTTWLPTAAGATGFIAHSPGRQSFASQSVTLTGPSGARRTPCTALFRPG